MPFCVACSALGAALGGVFSASRLTYAGGRDSILPKAFGRLHPRTHTPVNALVFQFVLTSVLIALGDFEALIGLFGVAVWLFYFLTVAGMIRLRRLEPELARPYRALAVLAYTFCFVTIALLITEFISAPLGSSLAFFFVSLGYPYHRLWHWKYGDFLGAASADSSSPSSSATIKLEPLPLLGAKDENEDDDDDLDVGSTANLSPLTVVAPRGVVKKRDDENGGKEEEDEGLEMNLL